MRGPFDILLADTDYEIALLHPTYLKLKGILSITFYLCYQVIIFINKYDKTFQKLRTDSEDKSYLINMIN